MYHPELPIQFACVIVHRTVDRMAHALLNSNPHRGQLPVSCLTGQVQFWPLNRKAMFGRRDNSGKFGRTAGLGECHRCDTYGRFRAGLRHAQLMRQGGWESQFEPGTQSSTIRQRHEHSSQREVNTMQQHVSPIGRWNLSPRRGRSRIAARFQMGCDCGRLAGSDVGKCSRSCNSCISCVRRLPFKQ